MIFILLLIKLTWLAVSGKLLVRSKASQPPNQGVKCPIVAISEFFTPYMGAVGGLNATFWVSEVAKPLSFVNTRKNRSVRSGFFLKIIASFLLASSFFAYLPPHHTCCPQASLGIPPDHLSPANISRKCCCNIQKLSNESSTPPVTFAFLAPSLVICSSKRAKYKLIPIISKLENEVIKFLCKVLNLNNIKSKICFLIKKLFRKFTSERCQPRINLKGFRLKMGQNWPSTKILASHGGR